MTKPLGAILWPLRKRADRLKAGDRLESHDGGGRIVQGVTVDRGVYTITMARGAPVEIRGSSTPVEVTRPDATI